MRKQLIIITITIMLICICLSGCNENSNNINNTNKFIGIWKGVSYFLNDTTNVTLTFYKDNTAKQEDEQSHIHWFNFEIDDDCLKLMLPELPADYAICYSYEFSNNYNELTLTNESLDTIILNKQ